MHRQAPHQFVRNFNHTAAEKLNTFRDFPGGVVPEEFSEADVGQ